MALLDFLALELAIKTLMSITQVKYTLGRQAIYTLLLLFISGTCNLEEISVFNQYEYILHTENCIKQMRKCVE